MASSGGESKGMDPEGDGGGGGGGGGALLSVVGEMVRHVAAGQEAVCHLSAAASHAINRDDVDINVLSPSKVPVSYR